MLHRALLGSLERFFGILIEHHGGAFPTWLAPVQAVVLSVGERHADYATGVAAALREQGFRVDADTSAEKVGAKIRHHLWQEKIPFVAVAGDQEVESRKLAVRHRQDGDLGALTPDEFAERLRTLERERR